MERAEDGDWEGREGKELVLRSRVKGRGVMLSEMGRFVALRLVSFLSMRWRFEGGVVD